MEFSTDVCARVSGLYVFTAVSKAGCDMRGPASRERPGAQQLLDRCRGGLWDIALLVCSTTTQVPRNASMATWHNCIPYRYSQLSHCRQVGKVRGTHNSTPPEISRSGAP
jgi:hypothetical protein